MNRQYVRCRILTIPGKVNLNVRISIDPRSEYRTNTDTGESISLTLFTSIDLQIQRPRSSTDSGVRMWNPNDSLQLSMMTFPLFIQDLDAVMESMKLTEMYVYTGDRLEVNQRLAEEKRRIFKANETFYVEIIPTILEGEKRVEGIRFTFNKEPSVFSLSLPELISLQYTLHHLQPELISLMMFNHYQKTGNNEIIANPFPPQF